MDDFDLISSFHKESVCWENYENDKTFEKLLLEDLKNVERISVDDNYFNKEENFFKSEKNVRFSARKDNILDSIQEEENESINISLKQEKTLKTVEMAQNFLINLALPLEDFQDLKDRETLNYSKKNSHPLKTIGQGSNNKKNNNNVSIHNNISFERLSRLSALANNIENSLYFKNHENENTPIEFENIVNEKEKFNEDLSFDFMDIKKFQNMQLLLHGYEQISNLKSNFDKKELLSIILEVTINIIQYSLDEDKIIEKFIKVIEFFKKKTILILEKIKSSNNYLESNIEKHSNFNQVLSKKNLWIFHLKKMSQEIFNLYSLTNKISGFLKKLDGVLPSFFSEKNFITICDEYRNIRNFFYSNAIMTLNNFFKVEYTEKIHDLNILKKIAQEKISKISDLFILPKNLISSYQLEIEKYKESRKYRPNILLSFREELENFLTIIFGYIKKYRKIFNVFQEYTSIANEMFYFRMNHINTVKIKIENERDKIMMLFDELPSSLALNNQILEKKLRIYKSFNEKTQKALLIYEKIEKTTYKKFLLIGYEKLERDMQKIKELMHLNELFVKFYKDATMKIQIYNVLLRSIEDLKKDISSETKKKFIKFMLIFQEITTIKIWLENNKKILYLKKFLAQIENSLALLKNYIDSLLKKIKR